jgi:hypothetical protein
MAQGARPTRQRTGGGWGLDRCAALQAYLSATAAADELGDLGSRVQFEKEAERLHLPVDMLNAVVEDEARYLGEPARTPFCGGPPSLKTSAAVARIRSGRGPGMPGTLANPKDPVLLLCMPRSVNDRVKDLEKMRLSIWIRGRRSADLRVRRATCRSEWIMSDAKIIAAAQRDSLTLREMQVEIGVTHSYAADMCAAHAGDAVIELPPAEDWLSESLLQLSRNCRAF